MRISDLPEGLEDPVWAQLAYHTVGLMKVVRKGKEESVELVGSGTFIRYRNLYGIVTADHVVAESHLQECRSLGINLPGIAKGGAHRIVIDQSHWQYCQCGKASSSPSGPDLGIVILGRQDDIDTIQSSRSFWNVERYPGGITTYPPTVGADVWTVIGLINEWRKDEDSVLGFTSCQRYGIPKIVSSIVDERQNDVYDYLHFLLPDNSVLPASFQGMSGGGLWRIPLLVGSDKNVHCNYPVLSGVAFYELHEHKRRVIVCHGQKSVYERVPAALDEFTNHQA